MALDRGDLRYVAFYVAFFGTFALFALFHVKYQKRRKSDEKGDWRQKATIRE